MTAKLARAFALMIAVSCAVAAQDAKTVLQSATKAMGDVNSIQFSGTGQLGILGQAYSPSSPWPENDIKSYTRTIDYASRSSKEELTQVEPTPLRRGGGGPFAGEQKNVNLVSGDYAWNQPGANHAAETPGRCQPKSANFQIWLTPAWISECRHAANNATAKKGKRAAQSCRSWSAASSRSMAPSTRKAW